MDHNTTPRVTRHALARCKEMGIPVRLAKAIWLTANVTRPSKSRDGKPGVIATSDKFPGYAIVVGEGYDGTPVIITVVFHTTEDYDRDGGTFKPKP